MSEVVAAPFTARGQRTRTRLVDAASQVFAEKQYLGTNVSDIVVRANVAHGTFYRYFDSKEQIFREVALDLQQRMINARLDAPGERPRFEDLRDEVVWRIIRTNRGFLEAYRENAALIAVIEQVATFNDELRALRRETRLAFLDRAQQSVERLQGAGLACRDVDAHYVANALGAMVDRFAYVAFVLNEPFELDEAARTLGLLWVRALGIEVPDGEPVAPAVR